MALTKVPAAMAESDLATQAELDAVAAAKIAGDVVQVVYTETGAVATGTTVMPSDDTIPQNTEGDQFMSLAITPTNVNNKLKIDVCVQLAHSAANTSIIAALFQDATAGAIAAAMIHNGPANTVVQLTFTHIMTAGVVVPTTFKIRGGSGYGSGTVTFNGAGGARLFGGVLASSITITEIKV